MNAMFDNLFSKHFNVLTTNKKRTSCILKRHNGCSKVIFNGANGKAHRFFKKDKIIYDEAQHR